MHSSSPALVFYLILLLALLIIRIPGIGRIFRTLNTMLHESGHIFMALLLNGEVHEVKLNSDLSGSASTSCNSRLKSAMVSFSGYPFAALSVLLLLALYTNGRYRAAYLILISLALVHLLFFVRNTFGMVWLTLFVVLLLVGLTFASAHIAGLILVCLILIALAEAILSTLQIAKQGLTRPRKAGDITNLSRSTHLPAWFWTLLIFALCAWIIYYAIVAYFPSPAQVITELKTFF
ncbi:MAG: M50 family metallopeptidase [Lentimicrobiaceae bacterium]|nr:M50 family metallopeptidase [Lentimicrobiaceae bacterium]